MDEFEKSLIADFINEQWLLFLRFCAERDLDEDEAEAIIKKLTEE
ncbi:hypothetical protein [Methylomonas sp. 11b]|nr:hypothetical protein [Methylomonas sp. 11b]